MICTAHDVGGLAPCVDMSSPREGLVGDFDSPPARPLGERMELLRNRPWSSTASVATEEHTSIMSVPSSSITENLCSARRSFAASRSRHHGVEVAERLVEVDRQA